MNSRLTWSIATVVVLAAAVLLVYGTHALTIVQRLALSLF